MADDFFKGDEIDKAEMFEKVKDIMIEILKGYPAHIYWGIFEGRFEGNLGVIVAQRLLDDGILEYVKDVKGVLIRDNQGKPVYRLTPKGVEFAVSFRNLNYSEKTSKYIERLSDYEKEVLRYARETQEYNWRTQILTIVMVIFTIGLFTIGLAQLILIYLQNPIF